MAAELWLAFAAAAAVVVVIPGPTVMLIVGYALGEGRRTAWAVVAGVFLGDLVAITLSLAGLGALLAASAVLFAVLKWIGAAYLVYLGVRLWRIRPAAAEGAVPPPRSQGAMLAHAFAVTALNPKSIAFFVAFLPQFIDPAMPVVPQMLILAATFLVIGTANAAAYALLAGRIRSAIRRPRVATAINRLGGTCLIGAGIATARGV